MALCGYNSYSGYNGYNSALCGVNTGCVTQAPGSEVCLQPPCVNICLPGAIMSTSSDLGVAQNNPCGYNGCGYGGYGYGGCGYGGYGYGGCGYGGYGYGGCGYRSRYGYGYPWYSRRCYSSCGPC